MTSIIHRRSSPPQHRRRASHLNFPANNNNNSNQQPSLEPFPDEGEVFQVFDQHKRLDKFSHFQHNHPVPDTKIKQQQLDEDPAKLTRLFYLQLYSSVLNSEQIKAEETSHSTNKKFAIPKALSDLKTTLRENIDKKREALKRTFSEDFEADAPESLHETVILEKRLSPGPEMMLNQQQQQHNHSPLRLAGSQRSRYSDLRSDRGNDRDRGSSRLSSSNTTPPVPVLNTRMKNLSQFSFRYREQHPAHATHPQTIRVVQSTSRSCHAKKTICSSLFLAGISLILVLVLTLVLSSPQALVSFFDVIYLPDSKPVSKPSLALCLPMPFEAQKLRSLGVSSELASFLLYTLSPYYPNPEVLDNSKLLTDLTGQYRALAGRLRRRNRQESLGGLKLLLKTVAPTCTELVAGCQTGTGAIVRGDQCCQLLFQDQVKLGPDGVCLVGGAEQLAKLSFEPKFPIAPRPFSIAKLTVVLRMSSRIPVDHRVVPWDPANNDIITASMIKDGEEPAFRDVKQDFVIRPGHLVSVTAYKRQLLRNSSPFLKGSCKKSQKNSKYNYAACQSSVVQLIAEKSLNCSLISLPQENKKLPICGPLEGLALMYILREQGALVTINQTMLHKFVSTITKHCPEECESQFFEPEVTADAVIDDNTAQLFGAFRPRDISIIELRYRSEEFIKTLRQKNGILVFLESLGSVSGSVLTIALVIFVISKLMSKRKEMLFKRR